MSAVLGEVGERGGPASQELEAECPGDSRLRQRPREDCNMGLSLAPCRRLRCVSLGLGPWTPHKRFEGRSIARRRKTAKRSKQKQLY